MASTQQSAVDYIRDCRVRLVTGLRNPHFIAQNLSQRKVLSEAEVLLILGEKDSTSQVRLLLDLVTGKGEDACYELLRILDDNRNTAFPMPADQYPELHTWISCFSFRHDPHLPSVDKRDLGASSKYQKQLKIKAIKTLNEKWRQSMTFLNCKTESKNFRYIPLVLDTDVNAVPHTKIKAYKKTKAKKLKTFNPTDKKKLSPYHLFKSNEKKILLVGKPGIGKTTVVQEILRFWADEEDSQGSYMFYFDEPFIKLMSEPASKESLGSFLFNKYLMPVEDSDTVWKELEENSENIVFIFDGIKDIVGGSMLETLVEKEVLSDAKIFITCRPEADISGDLSDWSSIKVEVQGFSDNSIQAYFQWMLGTKVDTTISALNNLELYSLCHVPMYAFIVTASILFGISEADNQPSTVTEKYVRLFIYCISLHNGGHVEKYIQDRRPEITFLASAAYQAILSKTVIIDSSQIGRMPHALLTPVTFEGASTSSDRFMFLHYTIQEFCAALFVLMNPQTIKHLLQQSQTDEGVYLKYVISFLCGLLSEKLANCLKCLIKPDKVQAISAQCFEEIMNTLLYSAEEDEPHDSELYFEVEDVLFVCQCLYEYQSPGACLNFLQKVKYILDLNDQALDPYQCCAVSYVLSHCSGVELNLMNCTISDFGIKLMLGCLRNLKSLRLSSSSVECQIWRVALQESSTDFDNLLRLSGYEMHLSLQEQQDSNMYRNAKDVLNGIRQKKVKLCLHMDTHQTMTKSMLKSIYESLYNIADIKVISPDYPRRTSHLWKSKVDSFHQDLFVQGALHEMETGQLCIQRLLSLVSHFSSCSPVEQSKFIYTLYHSAKEKGILTVLRPVFQAWPFYWVVDLSQPRNLSLIFVDVLKLQAVRKPVELWCSTKERDLKVFLQCLPYVSQVRFNDCIHIQEDDTMAAIKLLVDLFICASESGEEETQKMLSAACSYSTFPFVTNMEGIQSVFLCKLFSYIRDFESQDEEKSVLSALLPIFQSVPAVWVVDLSKLSVMLVENIVFPQVLELQVVKKPVELIGWSNEPDNLRMLLRCLPHVSQLRIRYSTPDHCYVTEGAIHFFFKLFIFASESGEDTLKMLSSVCSYSTFPFADDAGEIQSVFLLDLCSYVREHEFQTGKSLLPALLPIYQCAPPVWVLDLSKGVTSKLQQAMQLKEVKTPVDLWGWSNNRTELDHFLHCLPFVSQLRLEMQDSDIKRAAEVLLNLFICALEKGDATLKMLSTVCSYSNFPFADETGEIQTSFLLELYLQVRQCQEVLPALLPLYKSAPNVWILDLSKGVNSCLHETMQLQGVKRPVELRAWSDDKSNLKCFLKCLPFVSQIRFSDLGLILKDDVRGAVKLLVDLFISASECEDGTLKTLSTVCSYNTFPFVGDTGEIQCLFLLDLHSYIRQYESQSGKSILPALLPIYQSAPSVWVIDLSKGWISLLHKTMQIQKVKRSVELRGWSMDRSELKNLLQCVPYMLQLNCSQHFFQSVCEVLSVDKDWDPEKVAVLLRPLNFSVMLMEMLPKRTCKAVGTVLSQADRKECLYLNLIPQSISCQGANILFSKMTMLQKLRMNEEAILKVSKIAKQSQKFVTIEELNLVFTNPNPTKRGLCNLMSCLASILKAWTVRSLNLTECCIEGHFLVILLCLDKPFCLRMSDENLHQLAEIVYEAHDDFLTQSFLEKVDGDLSSSSLSWNALHYLLQKSKIPLKLDPQKNRFGTANVQHLLPLLHVIRFHRSDSQFVRNALKEIYANRAGHLVTNLLRASNNWIDLSQQELDSNGCKALCFALHYSDDVSLNLLGAVIPKEEIESILQLLHRVFELRVDRHLLLTFLHGCSVSRDHLEVTTNLLAALKYKLDFSHSSTVSLFGQDSKETMTLTVMDCRSISHAIEVSTGNTELIMFNCHAEDCALEQLFPVLSNVHLSLDKPQLLQLMLLTTCAGEGNSWKRAIALSRTLGKEINLSHIPLDCRSCESLGLVLDHCEEISHLNLSHCQLTDDCLRLLLPHLHKVLFLDLSNNDITDYGAHTLQKVMGKTQTVHIFNNLIQDVWVFMNNQHDTEHCVLPTYVRTETDHSDFSITQTIEPTLVMKETPTIMTKKVATVVQFDPEISVHDDQVVYRFHCEMGGEYQCKATELVFGMKGKGCVEYMVIHQEMHWFLKHNYEPTGPQYEIKTPVGEMYQLHLPHCEIEADMLGDISVAHIHDDNVEILIPVKMTPTHVVVCISGLSSYQTLRRKGSVTRNVRGHVLLFLEQINNLEQRLWVFLLSRNVPITEVKKQHKEYTFIKTSSDCILRQRGKYCLASDPKAQVQPKWHTFHVSRGPDYHSAFELFFDSKKSELQIKVLEQRNKLKTKWTRRVILKGHDDHTQEIKTKDEANTKGNSLLTEQNWKKSLSDLMDELSEAQLKKLKHLMKNAPSDLPSIPKSKLEFMERQDLVDLIIETWGFEKSVYAIKYFMIKLPRNDYTVTSILKPYLSLFGVVIKQENV